MASHTDWLHHLNQRIRALEEENKLLKQQLGVTPTYNDLELHPGEYYEYPGKSRGDNS